MSSVSDQSSIRIGDVDREQAMSALGEHMSSGRLTIDEYGDRAARVTAAKTRGELQELFVDLPQPHPRFEEDAAAHPQPADPGSPTTPAVRHSQLPQRLAAAALPLSGIVALVLFFATGWWMFFLLPAAVTVVGGALWGDAWKDAKREREMVERERRAELRARRHEMRARRRDWH